MKSVRKYMFWVLLAGFTISSCSKSFLNLQPTTQILDNAAFASLSSVQALTANLYTNMTLEGFGFNRIGGVEAAYPCEITDEAVRSYSWGGVNDPVIGTAMFGWWQYDYVRQVNDFINKIPNATALNEQDRVRFLAEARFIRAYYYFSMAKRYGGVPIITEVQSPTAPLDSLKVTRNTEQQVYDFIGNEIDAIVADLPVSYSGVDQYRATKYAALALKSRAMLYAASIAKYGAVQLNGVVGIPSSQADSYWKKAYDAADSIILSGQFSLYNSNSDPAKNFQQLFNGADPSTNPEAIFTYNYALPNSGHNFDYYNEPQSFRVDYGNVINPTVELAEQFEYTDGSPGKLKVNDANGHPISYSDPADLFKNKDPRFFATILYPNAAWHCNGDKGAAWQVGGSYLPSGAGFIELRRGIIDGSNQVTAGDLTTTYGTAPNVITVTGKDGPMTASDPTKTGFYIKKFMTEDASFIPNGPYESPSNTSTTPWMVFRYGEVLLNYAEAAIEMGNAADALTAVNKIRSRAGIASLTSITRDQVRHERQVEMAFENQRWWDLRRWRIADQVLDNTEFHALWPWLMWQPNTPPSQMKYTFQIVAAPKNTRTFPAYLYYERIDPQQIVQNSNLIQNPGY